MIASTKRSHSLRTFLQLGLGGVALLFILAALGIRSYLENRLAAQSDAQVRALSRYRAQQSLLTTLLDEEMGLRSYLTTGDSKYLDVFKTSGPSEKEALQSTIDNLTDEDREAAQIPLTRLERAVEDWHAKTAQRLIMERTQSPLRDLKASLDQERKQFEIIRQNSDALMRLLDARDNTRLEALDQSIANARWIGLAGITLLILLSFGISHWILLQVADPLVELSDCAKAGDGFPAPVEVMSVQEVDILSRALHALDVRVREREQLQREEHEAALAVQAYSELVQQIAREEDLIQAFEQALKRHLRPDVLGIFLRQVDGDGMESKVPDLSPEDAARHKVLSESMACRAIRQGSSVGMVAEAPTACICSLGVPGKGSYLCIPLLASGKALGLVNLQSRRPQYWNQARRQMAQSLVSATASALQVIRALDLAQQRAIRDGLTGVYNRRFLDEILPKLVDQSRRKGHSLSAMMLDIDHFKRFNDSFGHEVGDRVLTAFARCLENGLRAGDVVSRYGGEEFAVLLPETPYAVAMTMAERLRQSIETMELSETKFPPGCKITSSVGVATLPDHASGGELLLSMADKALYEAKGCGRNCVVGAEALGKTLER